MVAMRGKQQPIVPKSRLWAVLEGCLIGAANRKGTLSQRVGHHLAAEPRVGSCRVQLPPVPSLNLGVVSEEGSWEADVWREKLWE